MSTGATERERFERVKAILVRVADLPEAERQAVLDRLCEDDPELRREVEGLLRCDLPSPPQSAPSAGPAPAGRFTSGQILGNRYRIVRLLGRGGMGEVWQAYDLKLQVDVALKSIRAERFPGQEGLELLRREVRTARDVISPNVCRIFDLVDPDGHEFVSMEYIDGETLLEILESRGPLDLNEATRIASQFLAGLEAIHQAGLVHRDVKPENVMVTRTGRVVLMDFGIAKGIDEGRRGTIAGTPAYMAPEQIRGDAPDARADIFAAGVMLAEMGVPGGIRERTSRESIWKAVRQTPVELYESPWRGILARAVDSEPSGRYESARELARALEEVALRVEGAEEKHPYPGLHSFTAADAEFFFGREVEVEAVWKKLQRSNLLAIIGASGSGKTSFLHAGLLPAAPAGWRHIDIRPGSSPFAALTRALLPQLASDPETPEVALGAVTRWRRGQAQALVVVDQFEELFTLCRPDVQRSFAEFLGRMADEGDVHVLLLMRDDFLIRCHDHPTLGPILADLTALSPPAGLALRRALVQPALLCGYRFEDEHLADEMIAALEGERGAFPLLAFAAARLWEERDRERGLLTREACGRIGGVSGALAQHAEAMMQQIGPERESIVREIFRNLVTAQNTRTAADADELLSVFPDREQAAGILRRLIDARLLTTFEHRDESGLEIRRVEIVHESLLSAWPRLARWRTQDADGAQLRDQLRQAAHLWRSRGRSEDLLWRGTAYREYELWRGRYPGGLTDTEEAFARAMTARAGRQRRRRRAVAAGVIVTSMLAAVTMAAFGIRARVAQHHAEAEGLVALGRLSVNEDPRAALAYATASLERADNSGARLLATEAIARHGAGFQLPVDPGSSSTNYCFSPNGSRLVVGGLNGIRVYSQNGSLSFEARDPDSSDIFVREPQFAPDGDRVVSTMDDRLRVHVWSVSQGKEVRVFDMPTVTFLHVKGGRLFLVCDDTGRRTYNPGLRSPSRWTRALLKAWDWDEKEPEIVGRWDLDGVRCYEIDPSGRRVAYAKGKSVYLGEIGAIPSPRDRKIGEHPADVGTLAFDPRGSLLASGDRAGGIRVWSLTDDAEVPIRAMSCDLPFLTGYLGFDPSGAILAAACRQGLLLWRLRAPAEAKPVMLRCLAKYGGFGFDPTGQWIAVGAPLTAQACLIPVPPPDPCVLTAAGGGAIPFITHDGRIVALAKIGGSVRIWNLATGAMQSFPGEGDVYEAVLDPLDRYLVAVGNRGMTLLNLADGKMRAVGRDPGPDQSVAAAAASPDGRTLAGLARAGSVLRIVDVESGTGRTLENSRFGSRASYEHILFDGNDRLISAANDGSVRSWDLRTGRDSLIEPANGSFNPRLALARKARLLYVSSTDFYQLHCRLVAFDLKSGVRRSITTHGDHPGAPWVDDDEEYLTTGGLDGFVRIGPIDGEHPCVLWGPPCIFARVRGGLIVGGGSDDSTVYVWHVPNGKSLYNLPLRELLTRLRASTNFRVIRDPTATGGYRTQDDTFPGWARAPEL